jgi:hypothetical protein
MIYLRPLTWAGRNIPKSDLMPAVALAKPLYDEHFKHVSRYLQHCTDWRHEFPKQWGYPTMHDQMTRVLQEMYIVMARHGIEQPAPMM